MSNKPTYKGLGSAFLGLQHLDAASQTLTIDDANQTLIVPGGLNGRTYTLPNPSENNVGVWFEFAFESDAVSNVNIVGLSTSAGKFDVAVVGTTGYAASPGSTEEGNEWVRFLCITPTRYLQMGGLAPWAAVTT